MFGIKTWFAKRNRPNPRDTRPGGTRWRTSSIMGILTREAELGKTNISKDKSNEDESQKNQLA